VSLYFVPLYLQLHWSLCSELVQSLLALCLGPLLLSIKTAVSHQAEDEELAMNIYPFVIGQLRDIQFSDIMTMK